MNSRILVLLAGAVLAGAGGGAIAADPAADPTATAPVNTATPISQADLLARLAKKDPDLVVLDVRTAAEYAAGHVPGARNVSHDQLPAHLSELTSLKDKQVVLYCRSGRRTALAEQALRDAGFTKLLHLEGDWLAWEAENKPIEK